MLTKTLLPFLLYYFHIPHDADADEVIWLPNKSINLPTNFEDGKLPCSGQNIIFPDNVEEDVLISGLSITGLILPTDGEIVFDEGISDGILFGRDPNNNCTRVGNTIYKNDQVASWAQPDVWSSLKFNKATPDTEKVPCYNDDVVFPKKGQFAVKLPDRLQAIQSISIAGVVSRTPNDIESFITLQTNDLYQQFIETTPGMIKSSSRLRSIELCEATLHGCPCQQFALDIDCKLKYCPPPTCSDPIKPEGHCCEICGVSLIMEITDNFKITSFKTLVKEIVEGYGADRFDYHLGLLPHKYKTKQTERVQVIVMDKGEYNGACNLVMSDINHKISKDWVKSNVLLYSGNPSSESGQAAKIVVSVFFLVVTLMGATFGYYYRSSLSEMRGLRGGIGRGMLSRLQRRTESVMSLARRDSVVSTATTTGTSFRNPMYSSVRERVQVVAKVDES